MKLPRIVTAAIVAAATIGLVGCSSPTASSLGAGHDQIVVARAADVTTLDQDAVASSKEGWETLQLIGDSLYGVNAKGALVPKIAKSSSFNDDGTELTVKLRHGVRFSDGTPLTSADVAFTIANAKKGELQGSLYAPIDKIDTPDDDTVVLHYSTPNSGALFDLASYAVAIIPKDFRGESSADFWKHPIGAGPFALKKWNLGSDLTLVRNAHYYGHKPSISGIRFVTVPDANTRLLQLENGTVDLVDSLGASLVDQVTSNDKLSVLRFASAQDWFFTVNATSAPLNDLHARRAVSLAINRKDVIKAALLGYGTPGGSFIVPSALGGYSPTFGSRTNLAEAKQELAKSATPDGFEFSILYQSGDQQMDAALQIVQENLARAGITAKLEGLDGDAIQARITAGDWGLYVANIVADTDAGGVLQYYGATNGFYSGDADMIADMENVFKSANADFSGEDARTAIFKKAVARISESALQIALYDPQRLWGASSRVDDARPANPTGAFDFINVKLSS